ncbi:MAG TPA: helix-turn-helix domain-containing protein [Candidatus Brevibacterium intestinavium]|nr:helix-turn-helix domain-containing protein [Candidatus Brevibacterium intestinavium]
MLARELGYFSESSFSAAYKRGEGESPRSYRTRVLSESVRTPLQR